MPDLQMHIGFEFYDFIKLQTTHKVVRTKGLSNAHVNNSIINV